MARMSYILHVSETVSGGMNKQTNSELLFCLQKYCMYVTVMRRYGPERALKKLLANNVCPPARTKKLSKFFKYQCNVPLNLPSNYR